MKRTLKIFIVDDEHAALETLETILNEFCEGVEIIGKETSPIKAIKLINETKPDILFLDIEMPEMTGFELLECLPNKNFYIVFATAYKDYAIKAIKENASDYLLKPFGIKEVVATINKIKAKRFEKEKMQQQDNLLEKIAIKSMTGTEYILINDIINIVADGGYSEIFTEHKKITSTKRLSEIFPSLSCKCFIRVHNSHIVNVNHIVKYFATDNFLKMGNGNEVPISRRNIKAFEEFMNNYIG